LCNTILSVSWHPRRPKTHSIMSTDDDEFDLHARLEYCGPREPVHGPGPRKYYCTYCPSVILLRPHEFRLCQSRACIEHAISDRKERIFQIELSIPTMHRKLKDEKHRLEAGIQELESQCPDSPWIVQYQSLLTSLNANINFYAKNACIDRILALQEQIKDLASRLSRPSFSDSYRRELWERDEKKCYLCHKRIKNWDGKHMHVDHVRPRSKGGPDEVDNYRAVHPSCNRTKSDRDLSARRMKAMLKELRKSGEEAAKERLF
jgi:hypothetical protein